MTEMISPFNDRAGAALGDGRVEHRDASPGWRGSSKEINRQAAMIGYLDAFAMYTAASALAMVLVLLVRRRRGTTIA